MRTFITTATTALALYLCTLSQAALAVALLRLTIAESDGPPIALLENKRLVGGLIKDIGDALARELNTQAEYNVVPRGRVEHMIEQGKSHITCNTNPKWYAPAYSTPLEWTKEIYPQVERLVSLDTMPDIRTIDDLKGKKISTTYGYSYPPAISQLWYTQQATQKPELRMALMMNAVRRKLTEIAIVSELEFAYWSKQHPSLATSFKTHPLVISTMPTVCAVSKNSAYSATQLNQAIDRLKINGELNAILKRYGWRPDDSLETSLAPK